MKGFPKGWKPAKKKFAKAPTPPPGFAHTSPRDYKRSDKQREIDNAMDDGSVGQGPCLMCGKIVPADKTLCSKCEEEGKISDD